MPLAAQNKICNKINWMTRFTLQKINHWQCLFFGGGCLSKSLTFSKQFSINHIYEGGLKFISAVDDFFHQWNSSIATLMEEVCRAQGRLYWKINLIWWHLRASWSAHEFFSQPLYTSGYIIINHHKRTVSLKRIKN